MNIEPTEVYHVTDKEFSGAVPSGGRRVGLCAARPEAERDADVTDSVAELLTWPAGRLSLANVEGSTDEFLVVERSPIETSPDLETLAIPDIATSMERHGTVLLENDHLLAVDIRVKELASDSFPPYLPMLVVGLSDCSLEFQGPNVSSVQEVLKNGEAAWLAAGYGAIVNIGEGEVHVLVLALKK